MLKFVLFALVALLLVAVRANPYIPRTDFQVIQLEEPCVRQGGLCLRLDDCEPGRIAHLPKLCPEQHHLGVACCYL